MKKIIIPFAILTISLFACKKENTQPTVPVTPTITDTTKTIVDTTKVIDTTTNTVVDPRKKVYDIDGNWYVVVKIGKHEWFTENLKTTKLNDGTPIEKNTFYKNGVSINIGGDCNTPLYTFYNNDETTKNLSIPGSGGIIVSQGGLLYNVTAAKMNICPTGYKVPSQAEFDTLIKHAYFGNSTGMHIAFEDYVSPLGDITPWFTTDETTKGLIAVQLNQSIFKIEKRKSSNSVSAIRCMRVIE